MRKYIICTIAGISLAVAFVVGVKHLLTRHPAQNATAKNGPEVVASRLVVELSPEKFSVADLHTISVQRQALQHLHTVPGKVDYNGLQRVELKAPLDSTIHQVLVKPGDAVDVGAQLAILDSPDIGLVRAEVEKNLAELRLATKADEWAAQIAGNTSELLEFLLTRPKPPEVEKRFENKPLGDQRQQLLTTYARYILSEELWNDVQPMIAKGSVSVQAAKQRETNREIAKAEFQSAREQARFDQQQRREKARASRDYTQQVLEVSRQKLRTMLGTFSEVHESPASNVTHPQSLTRFHMISPIAGTIEQRSLAVGQRIPAGQPLFVVANTRALWITAELREHDWPALKLKEGAQLTVRIPALEGKEFPAEVSFVGSSVTSDSQAVPLIASVSNSEQLLKPGMFAWVVLPIGPPEIVLAIPRRAILTHDNRRFVFVEEEPRRYRRQDITTGLDTPYWIAVTHGLNAGDKVVDQGTFLLKSELLLEPEE